jgi:hypothetical protein
MYYLSLVLKFLQNIKKQQQQQQQQQQQKKGIISETRSGKFSK